MATGITFATWKEAREYIDRKRQEGYETSLWIDEATGKYKVAITPVFKAPSGSCPKDSRGRGRGRGRRRGRGGRNVGRNARRN